MTNKNLFLQNGANVSELVNAIPKVVVSSGFVADEETKTISYVGNPKALKFVIPIMRSVVESLDKKQGFSVIETPKTYTDKNGMVKTTKVVTFGYKNVKLANILCDNVNKVCKAQYEGYLAKKATK